MQANRVCILIAAIIAISLPNTLAFDCTQTGSNTLTCPEGTTNCFAKRGTDGVVSRGCVTTGVTCEAPACITCATSNCNAPLMCRQCDGSQSVCSTTNATGVEYNQLCTSGQVCLINLNGNGTLTRGCGERCTDGDANCKACSADNCNEVIFPENRQLCYQCTGADCNTVSAGSLTPCETYVKDQKCYTIGTDAKNMQRGCTSDPATKCAADTKDANCVLCDKANGCNSQAFEAVLGSCIQCKDKEGCVAAQDATKAVQCGASNYTQTENSCYKIINADGTVERGCTNALADQQCNLATGCTECKGNACNIDAATFSCLVCRSDNYAKCRQAEVGPEPCQNTSSTECFVGEWNGVVIRGCVGDMGPLMKYQCVNEASTKCVITTGANSNVEVNKYNGAASLQHMGLGLLGLIFIIRNVL